MSSSTLDYEDAKWIFVDKAGFNVETADLDKIRNIICSVRLPAQLKYGSEKGAKVTLHGEVVGAHPVSHNVTVKDCVIEDKPDTAEADKAPSREPSPAGSAKK
ncbi:MAG: hypothetical protein U0271_43770 [Polyangiaceae bacterium]